MIRSDIKAYKLSVKGIIIGFFTGHAFYAVLLYRIGNFFARHKIPFFPYFCGFIQLRRFACEISPYAKIGEGFRLYHTPGIVIGWGVEIGDNCEIFQNVTIGESRKEKNGKRFPSIGDNCTVYTGACVSGPIEIGSNTQIGANSVVLSDIPSNCFAAGAPAKVIRYNESEGVE